jgi:hypothetical protein
VPAFNVFATLVAGQAAVGLWLIDQPITRRLNASTTTAQ